MNTKTNGFIFSYKKGFISKSTVEIPGKYNYLANLTDELPDGNARTTTFNDNNVNINSGYYSRYYSLTNNDAMGSTKHRRGWSDRYLFAGSCLYILLSILTTLIIYNIFIYI